MYGDISMTDKAGPVGGGFFFKSGFQRNRREGLQGRVPTVSANASFTLFWIIQEMGAFERGGPLRPSQIVGPNISFGL
jgi:hypothetical protein